MTIDWTTLFKSYQGKWIALQDDEKTVIAAASSPKLVKAKAVKQGFNKPLLYKVPSKITPFIGTHYASPPHGNVKV